MGGGALDAHDHSRRSVPRELSPATARLSEHSPQTWSSDGRWVGRSTDTESVAAASLELLLTIAADRAGVPRGAARRRRSPAAYVIAHDAMLQTIAAEQPDSLAALRRIKGMGPVKLDQYGPEILAIVAARAKP